MDRIAVMGAGAVGGYYGALLAGAGHPVTLIGRAALAEAVASRGLWLDRAGERLVTHPAATTDPAGVAGARLVLFAVKSGDTEEAGRAIAPHLAPDAIVLSLQNGISNAERLAAVLGCPVVPVVVYVATELAGPGHVIHHGRGELVLGDAPGADAAAQILAAAGIPASVSPAAETTLWTKFAINCCWNAVSALTGRPYGVIGADPAARALMADALAECRAVAAASGIALPPDLWQTVLAIADTMPGQMSSTAQDLRRGRPTEIDHLNGEVARRAAALGLAAPVNNALWTLVRLAAPPA